MAIDYAYEQMRCASGFYEGQFRPSCDECRQKAIGYKEQKDGYRHYYCFGHAKGVDGFTVVIRDEDQMGTNAHIGILNKDGTVEYAWVKYDGGISHNSHCGPRLLKYHNSEESAIQIVLMGGIESIKESLQAIVTFDGLKTENCHINQYPLQTKISYLWKHNEWYIWSEDANKLKSQWVRLAWALTDPVMKL